MVDATTQAALEAPILHWRMLLYADFQGDVLRATSGIYDKVISGSGDSELDGSYLSLDHNLIEISPVKHNESGSDTVTVSLNGILAATEFVQDRFEAVIEQRDGDPDPYPWLVAAEYPGRCDAVAGAHCTAVVLHRGREREPSRFDHPLLHRLYGRHHHRWCAV